MSNMRNLTTTRLPSSLIRKAKINTDENKQRRRKDSIEYSEYKIGSILFAKCYKIRYFKYLNGRGNSRKRRKNIMT